jgi:hypothetical protein
MRDPLELLWIDPPSTARIRRKPEWQRLLDEARPRRKASDLLPVLENQEAAAEDRADVMEILVHAQESDGAAVRAAVAAGARGGGKFAPPLLVVEGELRLAFDGLETLKGLAANALPFAADDEALKAVVAAAIEYVRLPGLLATPSTLEALARRIREAFTRSPRGVPAEFLDTQTERALLEHRRYQTRVFHGTPHLRILLHAEGSSLLVFAPVDIAMSLPLRQHFSARLVVEGHVFADQYDPQPFALQLLAVARRVTLATGDAA